jgi:hypothetical protein
MENIEQQASETVTATETVAATEEVAAQSQPQLTIVDLQNLRAIIDTAVRRGTFGATEISAVGGAFDRLNAFLTAVAPAEQPAQPQA